MLANSLDAFAFAIREKSKTSNGKPPEGRSKLEISASIKNLPNGIRYSAVQLSCGQGTTYCVQALGTEAEELYEAAIRYKYESMGQTGALEALSR